MAVYPCNSSAVTASPAAFAAELRKSASLPEPAAVHERLDPGFLPDVERSRPLRAELFSPRFPTSDQHDFIV